MIRIELEDFSIDVPIEKRMTVQQFLAIAERLERISKRPHPSAMRADGSWSSGGEYVEHVYDTHDTVQHGGFAAPSHTAPHHDEQVHSGHREMGADEFRFEHESTQRTEYLLSRVSRQLDGLGEMQARLERLERRLEDKRH